MSMDRLQEKIIEKQNPTVAGLDPRPEYVPEEIRARHFAEKGETLAALADAYLEFNKGLMDALADVVPAVKPQSAYYELLGWEGVRCLKQTIDYAKALGLYVIADVKRGDIGSTAEAYSEAYLGKVQVGSQSIAPFDCDAVTVNGYLGSDGILPFVKTCKAKNKGIFMLVKTSNPSSAELQDLDCGGKLLYQAAGDLAAKLGADTVGRYGYSAVGAVTGATYPKELALLRQRLPHTFFLVPGYGAQGGGGADAAAAFDEKGRGAIVNSSRGIICAWKKAGGDYRDAARAEALRMKADLNAYMQIR